MKENKIRKELTLSPETIAYVEDVRAKNGLSFSAAVDQIVQADRDSLSRSELLEDIISKKTKVLSIKMNDANRNLQILLQMLNTILISDEITKSYTTDIIKSNALIAAEDYVDKEVERLSQLKGTQKRKGKY